MRDAEHDHLIELIPAFALDALDHEDAEAVRTHLVGCASCQEELAAYETVVDLMPLAVPDVDPSPALKGRLMGRLGSPVAGRADVSAPDVSLRDRISGMFQSLSTAPRWQPAALIIIIALVISNLFLWQLLIRSENGMTSWQQIPLAGSEVAPLASGIIYISAKDKTVIAIIEFTQSILMPLGY